MHVVLPKGSCHENNFSATVEVRHLVFKSDGNQHTIVSCLYLFFLNSQMINTYVD